MPTLLGQHGVYRRFQRAAPAEQIRPARETAPAPGTTVSISSGITLFGARGKRSGPGFAMGCSDLVDGREAGAVSAIAELEASPAGSSRRARRLGGGAAVTSPPSQWPIVTVAVARKLLTLVYCGLRDGHIRALDQIKAVA
jgi:hypothetical protein